jgi:hypothetical protein
VSAIIKKTVPVKYAKWKRNEIKRLPQIFMLSGGVY